MEPFLGQIQPFGFNFAPRGWAFCDGQILPVAQNQALFSLLGTIYGGDGETTFALPDLRGRSMIHQGEGAGLPDFTIGSRGGSTTHTLNTNQLPSHSHTATLYGENAAGTAANPSGKMIGRHPTEGLADPDPTRSNKAMSSESIVVNNTGGGQSFNIQDPFLTINVCIALTGVFPSEN